ncbi:hypothetical protein [Nocardioides litoris]|uniref:hypothetical protein n=1 Tax=Nocardioides litoris TaxID=1926648 RepID=UPI00112095BB|nr:hypothetical protein [Nocardioides litoris]
MSRHVRSPEDLSQGPWDAEGSDAHADETTSWSASQDPSTDRDAHAPADEPTGPTGPTTSPSYAGTGREVTCPECGTVARVAVNRRESHDFCATCDFPLFWTPDQVVRGDEEGAGAAALRRLPGTAGRTTVGSLPCPHCSEVNPVSGVLCLRCGGDLHPVAPPPPVVVAPTPPPAPEPQPEPTRTPVWWWVLGGVTLLLLVVVLVVLLG